MTFRIADKFVDIRKQYVIYDNNSFIADVGGFMGLLLGSSMLGLYNELESLLRKVLCKPLARM